jgi:very-short-patch-repair endonuclease
MTASAGVARKLRRDQSDAERKLWLHLRDRRTEADARRTRILESMGYLVLRFWNNKVTRNIDGVVEVISATLERHRSEPPHPHPLPYGERERV